MGRILSLLVLLTVLHTGQSIAANTKPVPITATSWLVADSEGKIIESQNAEQPRSIASITKLMTAMVVLDAGQNLDEKIHGLTRRDLIRLMLVKSSNSAANQLCENYPNGRSECVKAMNFKARLMGLEQTRFADPSGLNIMNVSTAHELIQLVIESSKYQEIIESSNTSRTKIKNGKKGFQINNTNPLVATKEFIVSKTGYIRASGGCIVMMLDTGLGRRIVVLLNSKNTTTRIAEANTLSSKF